ncbi:MAG: PKD domain-containing protein [Saprospiraceae bacterium]
MARHIIGGEITYECLGEVVAGTTRFRFTMKVYRDCLGGGAPYDNPAQFAIYRGTETNNSLLKSFAIGSPSITNIVPLPPPCVSDIPNVCVEQGIYVFIQDLPKLTNPMESYFVVYQRCCRNESITNIIDPGSIGATYMVEVKYEAQQVCNNSPVFKNFPPVIICNQFPIDFDHSAIDVDGDLLVYEFCSPLAGGGNILQSPGLTSCAGAVPTPPCGPPFDNVQFTTPTYNFMNPMGGNPQVKINAVTGFISGSPTKLGQYVVGVCVKEFRNGKLLSMIRREFQFNVADCTPTVFAKVEGKKLPGTETRYLVTSCGNNTVKFHNQSGLQQFIQDFTWQFDLHGSTFEDSLNWEPTVVFPDTGSYEGRLLLNTGLECNDTAYISVRINPAIHASFDYAYDTCVAGPVVFTDFSSGDGVVNQWDWDFGVPNGTSTEQNPSYLYATPGNHPVMLTVTDRNGCVDDTTQVINWFPAPPLIIIQPDSYLGCSPANIFFSNLSTPIDESYHIVWDFGDGDTLQDVISPTHLYTIPGIYDVKVAITSPIGCYIEDSFHKLIRVSPSPTADFAYSPTEGLNSFNKTVDFTDLSIGAGHWNWQFDQYGTSIQQNPTFTFPDTGVMTVRLIVTHPEGCKDSLTKILDIRPEIRWYMPNAFTPNGDGNNDGFFGKGFLEGMTDFRMSIWNRWGEQVFDTTDPKAQWNGQAQNTGGMSPAGVYVYQVSFTGPRGEPFEYKGYAALVR